MSRSALYAIDFGTSNSLLAVADAQRVHGAAPLEKAGLNTDPTVLRTLLYFPNEDEVYYGVDAIHRYVENGMQGRLLRSMKRFLPDRSFIGTYVGNRPLNLENLIGIYLAEVRRRADAHYGFEVKHAVLGRPALFSARPEDDAYAQYRLEKGAQLGGFESVEFLPEPVAAAVGFGFGLEQERLVLVADYGGGTSDYTVIRLGPKAYEAKDVLAIGGVPMAGDALDGALMKGGIVDFFGADVKYKVPFGSNVLQMPKYLMSKLCVPAEIALLGKRETRAFFEDVKNWSLGADDEEKIERLFTLIEDQQGFHLFEEIEKTKRGLSGNEHAHFRFDYPGIDIQKEFARSEFEAHAENILEKILGSLDETLRRAGVTPSQIDQVCCTGGTAQVPAIRQWLEDRFGKEKIFQYNQYHAVVEGLARRASQLAAQS